jgi:hypothetical protein
MPFISDGRSGTDRIPEALVVLRQVYVPIRCAIAFYPLTQ